MDGAFPFLSPGSLATALVAINFVAFATFGVDKAKAEAGGQRIREDTLLALALLGGTPGAYAGRRLFRHKTRKQPFSDRLFGILVVQLALAAFAGAWVATG